MTQSVQSGSLRTIFVPAGHTVTVSADAISAGNVYQQSNSTLLGAVAASGSLEIGPYPDLRGFIIVATLGALTYGEPVLSVSDGDGGPGGGASSFTELADAPESITPAGVVVGNDDGTALRMSDIITINENGVFQVVENGDSGIAMQANGAGGFSVQANGTGGIQMAANGVGGQMSLSGSESLQLSANSTNVDNAQGIGIAANIGGVDIRATGGGSVTIRIPGGGGQVLMPSLPTSDPAVAGALWVSAGTLKVSAG